MLGCAGLKPSPQYNRSRKTPVPVSQKKNGKKPETAKSGTKSTKDSKKPRGRDALDRAVSNWWGTPYRLGGERKNIGVDCSAYVKSVYKTVYGINLPRTASTQYTLGKSVSRRNLRRGDLVFFNTSGRGVSHVGIYLGKNKFTHASNSDGVTINSLKDSYYRKRYIGAKRIRH